MRERNYTTCAKTLLCPELRQPSSFSSAAPTGFIVLLNFLLPVGRKRCAAPYRAYCLTQHLVIELCSLAVAVVVYSAVLADPEVPCRFNCVNVCAEKKELQPYFSFCRSIIFLTFLLSYLWLAFSIPSVVITNSVCSGTSSARAYLWTFPMW